MECDIITFCASHITCEKRIELLANAIKSIVEQKCKTCMYVSISFLDQKLGPHLSRLIKNTDLVKVFINANTKMSQFEHFDFLCQQIDPIFYNIKYIMFTDDDDYSRNLRSIFYNIYIKQKKYDSILNPYVLYVKSEKIEPIDINKSYDAISVGKANVFATSEYFAFCVKLRLLIDFIAIVKKHKLLQTHMCDVAFSSVLHHITTGWTREAPWAYAYNQYNSSNRASKTYGISYYMKNYPRKFFNDLALKFNILEWQVCPGYTPIFSKNQYKKDGFIKRLFFK